MLRRAILAAVLAALHAVEAANFTIDPNKVTPNDRAAWCTAQQNTCMILCANNLEANGCDTNTLAINCLCQNGSAPGLQYYLETMPTFICNEAFKECIDSHTGDATAQSNCTKSIHDQCGTLDPNKANVGGSSTASSSGTPSSSGKAGSPTTTSAHAAAPTNMQAYGSGAALAAMGLFAYLL